MSGHVSGDLQTLLSDEHSGPQREYLAALIAQLSSKMNELSQAHLAAFREHGAQSSQVREIAGQLQNYEDFLHKTVEFWKRLLCIAPELGTSDILSGTTLNKVHQPALPTVNLGNQTSPASTERQPANGINALTTSNLNHVATSTSRTTLPAATPGIVPASVGLPVTAVLLESASEPETIDSCRASATSRSLSYAKSNLTKSISDRIESKPQNENLNDRQSKEPSLTKPTLPAVSSGSTKASNIDQCDGPCTQVEPDLQNTPLLFAPALDFNGQKVPRINLPVFPEPSVRPGKETIWNMQSLRNALPDTSCCIASKLQPDDMEPDALKEIKDDKASGYDSDDEEEDNDKDPHYHWRHTPYTPIRSYPELDNAPQSITTAHPVLQSDQSLQPTHSDETIEMNDVDSKVLVTTKSPELRCDIDPAVEADDVEMDEAPDASAATTRDEVVTLQSTEMDSVIVAEEFDLGNWTTAGQFRLEPLPPCVFNFGASTDTDPSYTMGGIESEQPNALDSPMDDWSASTSPLDGTPDDSDSSSISSLDSEERNIKPTLFE